MFGVKPSLITDFVQSHDARRAGELGFATPFWVVEWDVVMARKQAAAA